MCATVKALLTNCVRFPTDEGLVEVVSSFENRYGFSQCIGAVDVAHILILGPVDCALLHLPLLHLHLHCHPHHLRHCCLHSCLVPVIIA